MTERTFRQCRKDLCNEKAELMLVQDLWLRVAANLPATRHVLFNIWWTNKFFIIGGGRFSRFRHGSVESVLISIWKKELAIVMMT